MNKASDLLFLSTSLDFEKKGVLINYAVAVINKNHLG